MITKGGEVCVVGIWHLGSVVSVCLADLGYEVVGVDKDPETVIALNNGIPPILEPGLEELLRAHLGSKRLSYDTDLSYALQNASYVLITFDASVDENDEIDLSPVFDTSTELSKYLKNGSLVIVNSQVPVGTCQQIKSIIKQSNPSLDFDVVYSPENLRLGQAIECFKNPRRIVIGADSDTALDRVEAFYNVITAPKLRMNLETAEMTKHALNALLATSISFANEIGNLCDETGADAIKIAEALHSDERIGGKLPLLPGLGFAGGTLARDLKVLKNLGENSKCETFLINSVLKVNEQQNNLVARKLQKIYGSVNNLMVGILGLTYKAGTSTLRRSAALEIIKDLIQDGAVVRAYDPKASLEEIRQHREFEFCSDPYMAIRGTDALVILTDWPEFRNLDFDSIKAIMKKPVIIDAKNILDDKKMAEIGFVYFGVGRGQKL